MSFVGILLLEIWFLTIASGFLIFRIWKRGRRFMDLRIIALFSLGYFYLLPGLIATFWGDFDRTVLGSPFAFETRVTLLVGLPLVYVATFVGMNVEFSMFRFTRVVRTLLLRRVDRKFVLAGLSLIFFLLGVSGVVIQLRDAGGALAVLQNGARGYLQARVENGAAGGLLSSLLPVGALGLVLAFKKSNMSLPLKVTLASTTILSALLMFALLGVRHNSAMLIFGVAALIEHYWPRKAQVWIPLIMSGLLVGALVMVTLRVSGGSGVGLDPDLISSEYSQLSISSYVIEVTNAEGYLYGKHLIDIPMFLVPRAIWSEKPMTSTLNRRFWPEEAAVGSEKTPGLIAEGYASFGLVGVLIFGVLFGVAVRRADSWLKSKASNDVEAILAFAALAGWAYMSVRTGLFGKHIYTFGIMLLQTAILVRYGQTRHAYVLSKMHAVSRPNTLAVES